MFCRLKSFEVGDVSRLAGGGGETLKWVVVWRSNDIEGSVTPGCGWLGVLASLSNGTSAPANAIGSPSFDWNVRCSLLFPELSDIQLRFRGRARCGTPSFVPP